MAHSPLMKMLRRLAAEHVEAEHRGLPVESVREQRELRRRDFLKLAGLAAGTALFPNLRPAMAASPSPRIAIVGAGIAGLNAALTLYEAGYTATLYESDNTFGGRIRSDTSTWDSGHVTEWCGELIDSGHTTMRHLARRFGLVLDNLHAAEPQGSTETYYFLGDYYSYAEADHDFRAIIGTLTKQNSQAPFPTLYNASTAMGRYLDSLSLYDWIEKYVPGGHKSKLGLLLDVAYDIEYGASTKRQSSLNLVYLLPGPTKDLALFGYSDEQYHIRGGNHRLPVAIAAHLPPHSIRLRHRLSAIAKNPNGSIRLTFNIVSSDGTLSKQVVNVDRAILTLPFSILRTLDYSQAGFDSLKKTAIQQLGYGKNAKIMLQFASRPWRKPGPWGLSNGTSYSDTGYQNGWDATRAQPGKTGVMLDYLGSRGALLRPDQGDESYSATSPAVRAYAADFLRQIEPVFPGLSRHYTGVATLSSPKDDPNLRGSYSYWRVGQYTKFSGYEGARQGNIHFAGEHCSTNFQGYMEGGAEQGARAAKEILSDYAAGIFP